MICSQLCWAQYKIYLNEGAKLTNNTTIQVDLFHATATEMQLCNGLNMEREKWQAYQRKNTLTLPDGDGKKVVSVRFKEASGKITEQYIASIILDTTPPINPRLQIGNGEVTNSPLRNKLLLLVTEASFMKVSNDPSFVEERWLPFDSTLVWELPTGDGEKTVYAKFKDEVGNETDVISNTILLDTKAPYNTSIKITTEHSIRSADGTIAYTNDTSKVVNLEIRAADAMEMMLSNVHTFYEAKWEPYQESVKGWALQKAGVDGAHFVYVRFRDRAGNVSKSASDEIHVDTHPPVDMKFLLNENKPITNDENIKLTIFARGCDFMKISETKDFSDAKWEPYSTVKYWKLSGEDGMRRVYIIYKDSANNETKVVTDGILLDRKKPYDLQMILEGGSNRIRGSSVTVELIAKGANQMQVSLNSEFKGANWIAYNESPFQLQLTGKRGLRTVYARFRDEAGNITETVSGEVILEEVPLNCKVVINNGNEFANGVENIVNLSLFATHANQMMISNRPDFRRAGWEPYRTEMIWPLEEGEGPKLVYVKFKSRTGTESDMVLDDIIVDRSGPYDLGMEINSGENSTLEQILSVEVKAQDANLMQIATSPDFKGVLWKNYTSKPQQIKALDGGGVQRIYARFRDLAGNITAPIVDEILFEIQPLDNSVMINNGNTFCTSKDRKAILTLRSQNATEMMIANQEDFAGGKWEPFDKYKLWDLGGEDGFKRVYVKFRSHTKTESEVVNASIILDRTPPHDTKMWLSKTRAGIAINPSLLYVSVTAEDAAMMQISNSPQFSSNHWTWSQYTDLSFIHEIGVRQGEVTVWVRFKDEAGNVSTPISQRIFVDQRAPKGNSVIIKENSPYINHKKVALELHSSDAAEMRLGASANLERVAWQPYQKSIDWEFKGEDGIKHVYVQYKDQTNNISKPVSASIELDREGPSYGKIEIVDQYCTNPLRVIHLKFFTEGATKMMVSNEPDFKDAAWQRVKPEIKQWRLSDEDGIRTVYAKFADEAENETRVYSDNILLDRQAPKGSITFNDGADYTTAPDVTLTIDYGDAVKMMLSRSPNFEAPATWEEVDEKRAWKLDEVEGLRSIYMKLIDKAGNVSEAFMDTILLDTEAPIVRAVVINNNISAVKTGKPVFINSKVMGAKFMMVSNHPDMASATWEPYFANKEWKLDLEEGLKTVYVKFKDEYGNETQVFTDSIQTYDKLYRVTK
ncbi:MAG: hypothetical protein ACPGJS_07225 [Flammeovirgaceae bacterium]